MWACVVLKYFYMEFILNIYLVYTNIFILEFKMKFRGVLGFFLKTIANWKNLLGVKTPTLFEHFFQFSKVF